jgi:hypothetical protein
MAMEHSTDRPGEISKPEGRRFESYLFDFGRTVSQCGILKLSPPFVPSEAKESMAQVT